MDQQKYDTLYNSLNTVYAPAKQLIQQQQAALPAQYDAERLGLEQAKSNAFRDISSKARGMGVAFGGYSPSEQARYTGSTYIPAVAAINTRQSSATTALQEALNNIGIKQTESATGMYQTQVANEAAAAAEAAKLAENQRQFEQQMQMEQYKANLNAPAADTTDPIGEFQTYLSNQFNAAGKNPSRQQQDSWANAWFKEKGVSKENRQVYWNLFNQQYQRTSDPTADWLYKK